MDDAELLRQIEAELAAVVVAPDDKGNVFQLQGYTAAPACRDYDVHGVNVAWDALLESSRLLDVKYDGVEHNVDELVNIVHKHDDIVMTVYIPDAVVQDVEHDDVLSMKQARIAAQRQSEAEQRASVVETQMHFVQMQPLLSPMPEPRPVADVVVIADVQPVNNIVQPVNTIQPIDNVLEPDNDIMQSVEQSTVQDQYITALLENLRQQEAADARAAAAYAEQKTRDAKRKLETDQALQRQLAAQRQSDALKRVEQEQQEKKAKLLYAKKLTAAMVILMCYRRYKIRTRRQSRRSVLIRLIAVVSARMLVQRVSAAVDIQRVYRGHRVRKKYRDVLLLKHTAPVVLDLETIDLDEFIIPDVMSDVLATDYQALQPVTVLACDSGHTATVQQQIIKRIRPQYQTIVDINVADDDEADQQQDIPSDTVNEVVVEPIISDNTEAVLAGMRMRQAKFDKMKTRREQSQRKQDPHFRLAQFKKL